MEATRPRGKAVIVIPDGLGDLPVEGLGGLTPLEAARTPVMDSLAASGRFGLVDPIAPGVIPNTDSAVALLLGLPPGEVGRLKRGPVEAAGAGCALRKGDIAARANFATVEPRGDRLLVTDRRAGRITEGTADLAAALASCSELFERFGGAWEAYAARTPALVPWPRRAS